jgi:hypothetical protein
MDPLIYTLKQFCAAHHISLSSLYHRRGDGIYPPITMIGGRRVILGTDAKIWREGLDKLRADGGNATSRRGRPRKAAAAQ